MLQKLPLNKFEWIEDTDEDLKKSYNEESDKGYFLEVDAQNPEKSHKLHNIYHYYQTEQKLKKSKSFVTNLHDETEYAIHMRNLKQALNSSLGLKKVHRVIKFN